MENKTTLENLTIIIPINDFNKDVDNDFVEKAITSINNNKKYTAESIIVIHTQDNFDEAIFDKFKNLTFIKNTSNKTDFCSQINLAAKNVTTDYFSILEFDDELGDIYFETFKEYSDYYKNVSVFMPIVIDVTNENHFIKFTNSEALSRGIVQEGELGLLTHDHIKVMTSLNTSGSIFKTEDFIGSGGFKSNIKISFIYEYLLRASYNDQKIFVLPKFCYLHRNGRPNSYLYNINQQNLTQEEVAFWFETAKKEFYFDRDREVHYKLEVVE